MNSTYSFVSALGVLCCSLSLAVPAANAQSKPRLVDAQVQTQAVASGLGQAFGTIVTGQQSPAWIGYGIAAVPGEHHMCDNCYDSGGCGRTYLEGRRPGVTIDTTGGKVALEAPRVAYVFFRVEHGAVQKIRVFSPECELDAGGLPVRWLTDVNQAESVALLSSFVRTKVERANASPSDNAALMALAQHADGSATAALDRFVAAGQPADIRKHAAFWLAAARGREGFQTLQRLVRVESDVAFRRELVFPISISHEPGVVDALIQLAHDSQSGVRSQALFWLAQKAGAKAAGTLADAVANDPDTEVKTRAVFGLSQLPKEEGVPRLIEVARTNRNPAVRKKAMFWLGQSGDPRATAFFEEILRGK
ncbi:MAG TPA: HEAT repeat domain-containing protein [Vicinamibacterales bacterium]|jgi:hypothetical protein